MTGRRPSPPTSRPSPPPDGASYALEPGVQAAIDLAARLTRRPGSTATATRPPAPAGTTLTRTPPAGRRRSATSPVTPRPRPARRVPPKATPSKPVAAPSAPLARAKRPKPITVRSARTHVLAPPLEPLTPPRRATAARPVADHGRPVASPAKSKRRNRSESESARPRRIAARTASARTAAARTASARTQSGRPRPIAARTQPARTRPIADRTAAARTQSGPRRPRAAQPRPTSPRTSGYGVAAAGALGARLRDGGSRSAEVRRRPAAVRTRTPKLPPDAPVKLEVAPARESGWMLLAAVTALLIVMGLMMVLSASSVEALRSYGGAWVFFYKQAIWVAIGTVGMIATAWWDYRRWARLAWPMVVFSLVLLVAVHIPGVGISVSGSTRWLGFGFFTFQPSEITKFALLVFVADLLARRSDCMHESRLTLRPVVVVAGALGGLVLLQPDMGTAMVMVLIVLVELFVAGLPLLRMATVVLTSTAGAVVLAMGAGYRRGRVSGFLNPWADISNTGYQVAQSLVALGTGHLAGVGLGASRAKWGFLPNAHTDFIFAIVGEELGLIGSLLVLGLFAAFAGLGIRAAMRAPDRFGSLMAAGITVWVVGQALVNIGAVTGMLPVTGVPLPFLSFGGTALVVTMVAVGILLNIARHAAPRTK